MTDISMNKEQNGLRFCRNFPNIRISLSAEAVGWLCGTTNDNADIPISNHHIFLDLLSRMRLVQGADESFRRPQYLQPGQLHYSEVGLAERWNIGRKKLHNLLVRMEDLKLISTECSRTASIAAMTCVIGWTDADGNNINNPFYKP